MWECKCTEFFFHGFKLFSCCNKVHQNLFLLSLCLVDLNKKKEILQRDTHKDNNQILFDFGIMVKRYHNKKHTYSTHISPATVFDTVLYYFFPSPPASTVTAAFTHTLALLESLFVSLNILSVIQLSVKHMHTSSYKMHSQTQSCTQWAPAYLRLLLLGCDPARPGWSGLWRFWKETGHQQSALLMWELMFIMLAELCLRGILSIKKIFGKKL